MLRRSRKRPTAHRAESARAPIITDHLIIREAVAADSVPMQRAMDDTVRRESGLADQDLRNLTLAVDAGLLHTPTRMICEKGTGSIIGGVVTFASEGTEPPRLWLWFGPEGRGRDYEREALVHVVDHLHDSGTAEIGIRVRSDSTSDLEIVESAGFRRTADSTVDPGDGESIDVVELVHSRSPSTPGR